jgi:multiple sugar transport system ATP-binding protein
VLRVGSQQIELGSEVHAARPGLRRHANQRVAVGVRPEDLAIGGEAGAPNGHSASIDGSVELVEALGSELLVHFALDAARVETEGVQEADAQGLGAGVLARRGRLVARVPPRLQVTAGGATRFHLDPRRLHFFDPASEQAIVA